MKGSRVGQGQGRTPRQPGLRYMALAAVALALFTGAAVSQRPQRVDVKTMATPRGGRLQPAQRGPVRSAMGVPKVKLAEYRLTVTGEVDTSLVLKWEDLLALPAAYSDTILLYCVEGWEVWGNWKGILVKDLVRTAGPRPGAAFVVFHCLDGYSTCLPLAYLEKHNALLAYEVNGKRLRPDIGFPLRLVAFGKYGYKWAKWVHELELVREPVRGYWEKRGYSDDADVPLERRRRYEGDRASPLE